MSLSTTIRNSMHTIYYRLFYINIIKQVSTTVFNALSLIILILIFLPHTQIKINRTILTNNMLQLNNTIKWFLKHFISWKINYEHYPHRSNHNQDQDHHHNKFYYCEVWNGCKFYHCPNGCKQHLCISKPIIHLYYVFHWRFIPAIFIIDEVLDDYCRSLTLVHSTIFQSNNVGRSSRLNYRPHLKRTASISHELFTKLNCEKTKLKY